MSLLRASTGPALALLLGLPMTAVAQSLDFNGSNSLRLEHFDNSGNTGSSPFPQTGVQALNEFSLSSYGQITPYESFRFNLFGLANASDYRSVHNGGVLERINLGFMSGETPIPLRVELGDFYAYFSQRTLQRGLKGAQIELQPDWFGLDQSLVFMSGTQATDYKTLNFGNNLTNGVSWLVNNTFVDALSFNLISTEKQNLFAGRQDLQQDTGSIAMEHGFNIGSHSLIAEIEAARVDGDHADIFAAGDGRNQKDSAYFAQLRGSANGQLSYRLRVEQAGFHYRPEGSFVVPDRRSVQGFAGWTFAGGTRLSGRLQQFEDRFDSINPLTTRQLGMDLSGTGIQLGNRYLYGQARITMQDVEDEFATLDRRTYSLDGDVNMNLGSNRALITRLFVRDTEDSIGTADITTVQLSFSLSQVLNGRLFSGTIAPGLDIRHVDSASGRNVDLYPSLTYSSGNGPHRLGLTYGLLVQERSGGINPLLDVDLTTQQFALNYRFRRNNHELGLDANFFERNPSGFQSSEATRYSLYWRYHFQGQRRPVAPVRAVDTSSEQSLSPRLVALIQPGMQVRELDTLLQRLGGEALIAEQGYRYSPVPLLSGIQHKQQLVVVDTAGSVSDAAYLIQPDVLDSPADIERLYQEISAALIAQFGTPAISYSEGEFNEYMVQELRSGQFVRAQEWFVGSGVLRLGIPNLLNGEVRIEVQHKPSFAPPTSGDWGIRFRR